MRILLDENAPSGLRRILATTCALHPKWAGPATPTASYSTKPKKPVSKRSSPEIEACRISRISPAEISPSSFSPPMPGPSFAPSHRRCSARSRMSHPALSPLPPFTVRDDPGARLHPRAEFSPASTDKFLDAAKISAAMNRAGCRASVSVPTCSSPHHLSSISAVTCARCSEFPRHEFRVTGGLAPSHHCRRRDPQCHDSDQMRILSSLRPRHRSAVPY